MFSYIRIKKERFVILAKEICQIFKGENTETYFTPSVQEKGLVLLPNGKLWHHFNYLKLCLRKSNLLARNGQDESFEVDDQTEEAIRCNIFLTLTVINKCYYYFFVCVKSNFIDDAVDWLSSHIHPWQEVKEKWSTSFESRRSILINDRMSINDYIEKFQCLQLQQGKELVCFYPKIKHYK